MLCKCTFKHFSDQRFLHKQYHSNCKCEGQYCRSRPLVWESWSSTGCLITSHTCGMTDNETKSSTRLGFYLSSLSPTSGTNHTTVSVILWYYDIMIHNHWHACFILALCSISHMWLIQMYLLMTKQNCDCVSVFPSWVPMLKIKSYNL